MAKFLFIARGPGETSQASSLAKYMYERGEQIIFAVTQPVNAPFVKKYIAQFTVLDIQSPHDLQQIIKRESPAALVFFNSKTWTEVLFFRPKDWHIYKNFYREHISPGLPTACVDSNWLFDENKYPSYPYITWADRYLINIHPQVFSLGLKRNGGNFPLTKKLEKQMVPIGSIPTHDPLTAAEKQKKRQLYGIQPDEKLIFAYFSGLGASHHNWALRNLLSAVIFLTERGKRIRVLYVGSKDNIPPKFRNVNWLLNREVLDVESYYEALASSDLIFQHQGLATMAQAICAQIPIIANVERQDKKWIRDLHFWEVDPFVRAGVCVMLSKTTAHKTITSILENLLFDERKRNAMQTVQKKLGLAGEPNAYQIIQQLVSGRS